MKKTLLFLALTPLFSATAFAAGYTGPGAAQSVSTVAQALEAKDDTPVVLEGKVLKRLEGDTYDFQDASGSIHVEIDDEDWPANSVSENSQVRLHGEVDRDMTGTEIDVDRLELLNP